MGWNIYVAVCHVKTVWNEERNVTKAVVVMANKAI